MGLGGAGRYEAFKVIVWREAEWGEAFLMRNWPLRCSIRIIYLRISVSFGLKRVLLYVYYVIFFLDKTSWALGSLGKIKIWISFSPWILFYIINFLITLQMTTAWKLAFLNTAIIILMHSLNIPHSKSQNTSKSIIFSCWTLSIFFSKLTFRRHFTIPWW